MFSPNHPLLGVLSEIPVADGVEYVSVIGVKDGPKCVRKPGCRATDGVVTYDSARFSPPEDELIIKAGHDVHRHPEAVNFILQHFQGSTTCLIFR